VNMSIPIPMITAYLLFGEMELSGRKVGSSIVLSEPKSAQRDFSVLIN